MYGPIEVVLSGRVADTLGTINVAATSRSPARVGSIKVVVYGRIVDIFGIIHAAATSH
jgi:hypothetical protein